MTDRAGAPLGPEAPGLHMSRGVNLSRRALLRGAGTLAVPWLVGSPRARLGRARRAERPRPRRPRRRKGQRYRRHSGGHRRCRARRRRALPARRLRLGDAAPAGSSHPCGSTAGATLIASPDDTAFDPHEKLGYEIVRRPRDHGLQLRAAPGARACGTSGIARAGSDRWQPTLARRPQADRAQGVPRRHDPRPDPGECAQLQHQPARLRSRRHPRRHHPQRLLRRDRSGLLPPRAHHRVPRGVARRRDRAQEQPRARASGGRRSTSW